MGCHFSSVDCLYCSGIVIIILILVITLFPIDIIIEKILSFLRRFHDLSLLYGVIYIFVLIIAVNLNTIET